MTTPTCSKLLATPTHSKLMATPTHPSSVIPSTNSFLVNSHCVAALNFQASMRTVMLKGSRPASSQNRLTPSANILSSSTESVRQTQFPQSILFDGMNFGGRGYDCRIQFSRKVRPPLHYVAIIGADKVLRVVANPQKVHQSIFCMKITRSTSTALYHTGHAAKLFSMDLQS